MYKKMREYSKEEFIKLVQEMTHEELLEFSAKYGGYPVLFRMALDYRLPNLPFIQTGSAIIVMDEFGRVLLQERTDRNKWGLPGGCQELGEKLEHTAIRELEEETGIKLSEEDLILIDTLSGDTRKNSYPNGDIVYNNTSLYFAKYDGQDLKKDSESKRLEFVSLDNLPENLMDRDLIECYINKSSKKR